MALPDLLGRLPDTAFSKAAFTTALGLATYLLAVLLYGLLLHPLRRYPGPLYARFTRIPFWIASLRGDSHTFIHALHEKHGPVVRYSPSAISYTEAQAWRDVCGYEKGRRENPKASWFQLPAYNGVPSIFAIPSSDDHARVRRVFSPAFSERSLKQQEALFQRYVDLLLSKIRQQCQAGGDGRVEMVRMLNYMAFDIMAELCFGEPLGLLDKMEYSQWVASVFGAVKMLPFLQICEYYPLLGYLLHKLEPKWARKMRDTHFRHSADRVDSRLADGSDKPDIWNLLLSEDGKQHRLTLDEMHSNSETFMLAGTETTGKILICPMAHITSDLLKIVGFHYSHVNEWPPILSSHESGQICLALRRDSHLLHLKRRDHHGTPCRSQISQCMHPGRPSNIPTDFRRSTADHTNRRQCCDGTMASSGNRRFCPPNSSISLTDQLQTPKSLRAGEMVGRRAVQE